VTPRQRVLEANYGEYTQRAADGINSLMYDYQPTWTNAKWEQAQYLLAFFAERGRWKPFWWQAPEEPMRLFVVDTWPYKWKIGRVCDVGPCNFIETSRP
jgi:phage-related protein